ncbi:type III secretion system stator protein SctL [Nitratireductor sp. ZSWI3]|uniref:type III secretion system stator protein SctL n=1 Tax=Nitratireductor sp. ZSWI3 TaxID=2966359 RepID=UPI0021500368|nr:type III secretion system stator protein SctL [Nitratireductor sp. ZSWI3]MCR4264836.1 type III secretion system stator protein SctL [Nitratireductor sp. ZSWI3]
MTKTGDKSRKLPLRPTARLLKAEEAKAWQDGYAFLAAAEEEARQMREAARRAYAAEYARGFGDGKAKGEAEAARLVGETVGKVDRYLAGLRGEIVTLALDVVEQVLGAFDTADLVARAAERAIADIRSAKYLRVTVHPDAVETMRNRLDALVQPSRFGFSIEVNGDAELAADACIIATDAAVIDAGIDVQLKAIAESLETGEAAVP